MVNPPESFGDIPLSVWEGIQEAFGIGYKGTTEAIKQIPESIQSPLKIVSGISSGIIIIGVVVLGVWLLKK